MEPFDHSDEPHLIQTPTKKSRIREANPATTSQERFTRRTRSQDLPDWSIQEMLTLVKEIRAVEEDCLKALSSYQKWKIICDNCAALDVLKTANQCRWQWGVLLADYKKVVDWEYKSGSSYWSLSDDKRNEFGLSKSFDIEIFELIRDILSMEDESDSELDSDSEIPLKKIDSSQKGSKAQAGQKEETGKESAPDKSFELGLGTKSTKKRSANHQRPPHKSAELEKDAELIQTESRPQKKLPNRNLSELERDAELIQTESGGIQKKLPNRKLSELQPVSEAALKGCNADLTENSEQADVVPEAGSREPGDSLLPGDSIERDITVHVRENDEEKNVSLQGKQRESAEESNPDKPSEQEIALKLKRNSEQIDTILQGKLDDLNADELPSNTGTCGLAQMEFKRQQADHLITILGEFVSNLNHFVEMKHC